MDLKIDYRICCVTRKGSSDALQDLETLGGIEPWTWEGDPLGILEAIDRGCTFYAMVDGGRIEVIANNDANLRRLTASPAGDERLILQLPRCPSSAR